MTSDSAENVRLLEAAARTVQAAQSVINKQDERIANMRRILGLQRELLAEQAGLGRSLATAFAAVYVLAVIVGVARGEDWLGVVGKAALVAVAVAVARRLRRDERAWRAGE